MEPMPTMASQRTEKFVSKFIGRDGEEAIAKEVERDLHL